MSVELNMPASTAYKALVGFEYPNPMQMDVWEQIQDDHEFGVGLLIKGPTGSGKTESVAIPVLASDNRRLVMIYPTRSLVDDQIGRFCKMLSAKSRMTNGKPVTLNVDTGATSQRVSWVNGTEQKADGNMRRHLYQGDVIITTIDKFLYRFFGYGEPKKSYIFPLRINHGLKSPIFCFDEAHCYDDVAFTNFAQLTRTLYERGRDVVLTTATMPTSKHKHFDFLDVVDYTEALDNRARLDNFRLDQFPEQKHPGRHLSLISGNVVDSEDAESELVGIAIKEAIDRYQPDQRMIVTVERVLDAVKIWRTLREEFGEKTDVFLYHGRLTQMQRTKVYHALKDAEFANSSYLLVSTSAIEVGCDLNAHILITQLCDPDRLIQRAGRCNRRMEMERAEVAVLGDTIPEWLTCLVADDMQDYLAQLKLQDGKTLDPAPLLACLLKTEPKIDYRIQMMFDMLYEYVYEAKLENKPLHDKGLIITRSWEPSLTICTGIDENRKPQNAVSVAMRSCKTTMDDSSLDHSWDLFKLSFNQNEGKFEEARLRGWECAYTVDAYAHPNLTLYSFNEEEGWVDLPKLFNISFGKGYRRILLREKDGEKNLLWYISSLQEPEKEETVSSAKAASTSERIG